MLQARRLAPAAAVASLSAIALALAVSERSELASAWRISSFAVCGWLAFGVARLAAAWRSADAGGLALLPWGRTVGPAATCAAALALQLGGTALLLLPGAYRERPRALIGLVSHPALVATGETLGGGPIESAIRVVKQDNMVSELDAGIMTLVIKGFDAVAMQLIRGVSFLMPNFGAFAESGGINTASFAAYGFDIPSSLMLQHVCIMLAYVFLATCAGYFFLKTKEIAA